MWFCGTQAKSGITNIPGTSVTGDIGVSPITFASMTGFSLVADSSGTYSQSTQVNGNVYAADYISPTPSEMTTAVGDMETAYTDAAGRAVDELNLKDGLISGETFIAGVYEWGSDVSFTGDITIEGSDTDVFIFKISGDVKAAAGAKVILTGGAQASNIFWQVAGLVTAGAGSHLEGTFLVATSAAFGTGSSLNGRVLAQTKVTLDAVTINQNGLPIND